ncbi:MAG: hypothetical protein Q7T05_01045 [Dehalococcoidia bacterium]|nr:hypothetical protein [Dehalococcoidia bacterium]
MYHVKEKNLFESITELLEDNQAQIDSTLDKWLSELSPCIGKAEAHKGLFNQWAPLRVCISIGEVKKTKPKFSVRFLGQEVGNIVVDNGSPLLCISPTHYKNNQVWFAKHHPKGGGGFGLPPGMYEWKKAESRKFRRDFLDIQHHPGVKTGIPEHHLEAAIIEEMESGRISKFDGKVGFIQPVKVAKCSLQIPLPISASKGYPVLKFGHIDILARRGRARNVKLSVWELKSPGTVGHAVNQAYIYALTLRHILRSLHGKEWYRFYGFSGNVPTKLHIEAVVAITVDKKKAFLKQFDKLVAENPLWIGDDRISFFVAFYDKANFKIKSFNPLMGKDAV